MGFGAVTINSVGTLNFYATSSAGSGTISNNGALTFYNNSTAGSSTITNLGGFYFRDVSTANLATVNNNNLLDLSYHTGSGLSIGSLGGGGTVALGSTALTVGGLNTSTVISGLVKDGGQAGGAGGSLTKAGAGTLTLTEANTYTGGTTITGGTLSVGADDNLGTGGVTLSGGVLQWTGGSETFGRTVTLGSAATGSGFDIAIAATNLTVGSSLTGTGSLTKTGAGTLTLTGVNTFTGTTTVSGGALVLGNSLALQNSTVNTTGGGTLSFGALTTATVGGLSGSQNLSLSNGSSGPLALTVGSDNANTTYTGTLSGTGSLTKTGTGTLALTGNNTYTGPTTVSGGTLRVGPDHPAPGDYATTLASSSIAVTAGGTLIGNGTFGAASTVNGVQVGSSAITVTGTGARLQGNGLYGDITIAGGGTIAPGNSLGKISGISLLVEGGTTFEFELGPGNQSDTITLSGAFDTNLSSSGNFTFTFDANGGPLEFGSVFTLVTFSSTNLTQTEVNNRFVASPRGSLNSINGDFILSGSNLSYRVANSEVPEPGSLLLLVPGLSVGGIAIRIKRRQKRQAQQA